ncbi:DUF58 domain-containing protein [Sphingosinicella sp.]|uniref:DUF58 domain-containing protein n=1 Tax=Sphingosinicella sp. TaxID=1917971 RepID=UPI0017B20B6E|nr:DUF58 domain-containing protein [Sphingosinicella sp.]MBA4757773.1 DUF58 domain-containing protein [Sphingosinicella sp.]
MSTPLDAERIAAMLGPLRLTRARARIARQAGAHPRRVAGPGAEFWQYRMLNPGEAADKVDWRRSGRSDELYVREREREDPVRLWLWSDASASMDYASDEALPRKKTIADTLVAALGLAAYEAGETCCAPPDPRPLRGDALLAPHGPGDAPRLSAPGPADIVLAAGDFLGRQALDWIAPAAAAGAQGVVIAVADPAEIAFPFSGRVHFDAVEPGDRPFEAGRAEALGETYAAAWAAHRARLAAACDRPGWLLVDAVTSDDAAAHAARIAGWLRAV